MKLIESGHNPRTGGCYAFFEHGGKEYYADLCLLSYSIEPGETECMIFPAKDKQVTSWLELYCKRGIPVTESELLDCIDEFINRPVQASQEL